MMEIENLIKIIDAVSESELTGLKYEEDDVKIHLTKKQGKVQVISAVPGGTEIPSAGILARMHLPWIIPGRHSYGRKYR